MFESFLQVFKNLTEEIRQLRLELRNQAPITQANRAEMNVITYRMRYSLNRLQILAAKVPAKPH